MYFFSSPIVNLQNNKKPSALISILSVVFHTLQSLLLLYQKSLPYQGKRSGRCRRIHNRFRKCHKIQCNKFSLSSFTPCRLSSCLMIIYYIIICFLSLVFYKNN